MKWWIALLAVSLFGCREPSNVKPVEHYDLSSQLRRHVQTMFKENAYLIKYLTYNGKPEQVVNRKPDWNKELDPFFEADINSPAMSGLYAVDTTVLEDSLLRIRYTANDDGVDLRLLSVQTDRSGNLISFEAEERTESMLSTVTRSLRYDRLHEFRYDVKEDHRFFSDNAYTVVGEIHMAESYFR